MSLPLKSINSIISFAYISTELLPSIKPIPCWSVSIRANWSTTSGICRVNPNWRRTQSEICISTILKYIIGILACHIWYPSLQIGNKLSRILFVHGSQITLISLAHQAHSCKIISLSVESNPKTFRHSSCRIVSLSFFLFSLPDILSFFLYFLSLFFFHLLLLLLYPPPNLAGHRRRPDRAMVVPPAHTPSSSSPSSILPFLISPLYPSLTTIGVPDGAVAGRPPPAHISSLLFSLLCWTQNPLTVKPYSFKSIWFRLHPYDNYVSVFLL